MTLMFPVARAESVRGRAYPLRDWTPGRQAPRHSRRYSDAGRRAFTRILCDRGSAGSRAGATADAVALAAAADAFEAVAGWRPDRLHGEAAFGLLHHQVEGAPLRRDREAIVLLASAVLAARGERVHLVTDSDRVTQRLGDRLGPVLDRLRIPHDRVMSDSGWDQRRAAWGSAVVFAGAREIAMDFLRDALRWPGRADDAARIVEPLLGRRSRQRELLMQGLPWGLHIDADSTLVDSARTPVVLTRDGHPMYEIGALRQAMELADTLVEDEAFRWHADASEVDLLGPGLSALQSMADRFGGIWRTPHLADMVLKGALTASRLLEPGRHYELRNNAVSWLLGDPLIPGMAFYGRAFLTRFVEIREELDIAAEREAVGRVSYQQVFNRYLHLCGCSHDAVTPSREFRAVYGLRSAQRWPLPRRPWPDTGRLVPTAADKLPLVMDWVKREVEQSVRLLVTVSEETTAMLRSRLAEACPTLRIREDEGETIVPRPGDLVIASARELEQRLVPPVRPEQSSIRVMLYERSPRLAEDRRCLSWLVGDGFADARVTLLLSRDDGLFDVDENGGRVRLPGAVAVECSGPRLERAVRGAQRRKAANLFALRRNLMLHDVSMDALLAFSGKGVFR